MTRYLALALPVLLAACASQPSATVASANPAMVCESTYVTGSALPVKRCETPEEKERQRKLAAETASTLSRSVIVPKKDGSLN
jgi:hypothetical protein